MKNSWNIFKQDLRNIKRVPLVGLLILGLAILPSLYAWFNLSASWDPYSNTEDVKIAIVNEDAGAEVEGESINIGEQLEENLKDNDSLGWVFTSREEAEKGIKYGDYYAGVFIKEDFSSKLAKVVEGKPVKASVEYQVNDKKNAIAPKMTSAGASSIVNTINDQFVNETSHTLFEEFDKLGIQLEEDLPTIRKIENALFDLDENMPEIMKVGQFIEDVDQDWNNINEKIDYFLSIKDYLPQIHEGADIILTLQDQFPKIYELSDSVLKVEETLPTIEKAVEEFNQIGAKFSEVDQFLTDAGDHVQQVREQIKNNQDTLNDIAEQASSLEAYMQDFQDFLSQAEWSAEPFVQSFQSQIMRMNQTLADIGAEIESIEEEADITNHEAALDQLQIKLNEHILYLQSNIQMYSNLYSLSEDENINTFIGEMEETAESFSVLKQDLTNIVDSKTINREQIEKNLSEAQSNTNTLATWLDEKGNESLENSFSGIQDSVAGSDLNMDQLTELNQTLQEMLTNADGILAKLETDISGMQELPEMQQTWDEVNSQVQESFPVFVQSVHAFSNFIEEDLPKVEEKVNALATFVEEDLPQLEENYLKVADLLEQNLPAFESAIHDLAAFSKADLPELSEGVSDAADKVHQIENKDQLNKLIQLLRNDLAAESDFFASPVELVQEDIFPIPNYGSANAPFYTTLSLWVGALLLSNLLSTNLHPLDNREGYTQRQIYFGRLLLFLAVAILQGLIVSIGDLLVLDVYASDPLQLVLFSLIIAVVFMTIVYTFASILGNIGKALMIVLLVLQLSSGGGTFPIEVAPPFFQALHPFMPFTYGIDLLREAVGGIIPEVAWTNILMLLVFLIIALVIGVLLKPLLAKRIEHTARKSKDSRLVE
ncbi:YhgE/Pip domain-containing protein [Gracilibacillus caseinilyticus]|uniref:YhgE/Pip domain-containing protein n=1 Tax=Gracilibacillus caseinilyticus TaxID=2932256 RepID=A0ABY4EW06_9BACI|nr:YhgE/Pip domain-containing protein [Gracilibacillus caseinilyticus]UOQ48579.1 YhgE/Pip domain-containing protein [Gracilibacillus caseinilyticus]